MCAYGSAGTYVGARLVVIVIDYSFRPIRSSLYLYFRHDRSNSRLLFLSWPVLALICVIGFGKRACPNIPGALLAGHPLANMVSSRTPTGG